MENDELLRKVAEYFERIHSEPELEQYKPDKVGYWKIITGTDNVGFHRRELPETLHGKFSDAVAYAVQQEGFYSSSYFSPSKSENGLVKKACVKEVPESLISSSQIETICGNMDNENPL